MKNKYSTQNGQALMTLVVYVGISILVISGAVIMVLVNSLATNKFEQGSDAYYIAESGIENAIQRLLRDPNYTGEVLSVNSDTATIQVSGATTKTIISIGKTGNFIRRIDATVTLQNDVIVVQSWKEVF